MADDNEWLCSATSLHDQWPLPACPERPPQSRLDLHIIRQPEERHRARYLSEGSRGAIKDRSGSSHCTVQLIGYYRPARLEIFASKLDGVTPHPNYSTINVGGRGGGGTTTPCRKLKSDDGVDCVEVMLRPETNMTAVLDCVGLLKMCTNGEGSRKRPKKASDTSSGNVPLANHTQNSVRIVFRAYVPDAHNPPHSHVVVQRASESILCGTPSFGECKVAAVFQETTSVQQLGSPEVLKMSASSCSASGGDELFLIGRNFGKDARVIFREYSEDGSLKWSSNGHIHKQYHHQVHNASVKAIPREGRRHLQCHIVCTIPEYPHASGPKNVSVSVCVACGSKSSHPMTFHYTAPPSQRHDAPIDEDDWRPPDITTFVSDRRLSNVTGVSRVYEQPLHLASEALDCRDHDQSRRGVESPMISPCSTKPYYWPGSDRLRHMPYYYCSAPSHSSAISIDAAGFEDDRDDWAPPQADI